MDRVVPEWLDFLQIIINSKRKHPESNACGKLKVNIRRKTICCFKVPGCVKVVAVVPSCVRVVPVVPSCVRVVPVVPSCVRVVPIVPSCVRVVPVVPSCARVVPGCA